MIVSEQFKPEIVRKPNEKKKLDNLLRVSAIVPFTSFTIT